MRSIVLGLLAALSVASAAYASPVQDPSPVLTIQTPANDVHPTSLDAACRRVVDEMQNERNIERAVLLTSMARSVLTMGSYGFLYVASEQEEQFQAAADLRRARRNWLRTFCADSLEVPPALPVQ